jgi:CRP-like cAMP-binding protein
MIDKVVGRRVRSLKPGEDIIREGDRPRYVYLVLDGWACRYKMLEDGRRQIVSYFLPGDLCDQNVFILREMDHGVSGLTKVRFAEIGRNDFEALSNGHPRLTQALNWCSLVSAAIQREWTLSIGQRSALERIAHLLCEIVVRLKGVGRVQENSCEFPVTQVELADTTGLTSVHVNRMLQELRSMGLITLARRRLTVHDLPALKRLALFNPNYLHLEREGRHLDAND